MRSPSFPLLLVLTLATIGRAADALDTSASDDSAGCQVELFAHVSPTTVSPGGVLHVDVGVENRGSTTAHVHLVATATGPATYRRRLGSGPLAPGAGIIKLIFAIVPGAAPAGDYDLVFDLTVDGSPCASESFVITVVAPTSAAPPFGVIYAESPWATMDYAEGAGEGTGDLTAQDFSLALAYPNPFEGMARLTLVLAEAQEVRAEVYDALGRRVATLHDGPMESGEHTLSLDGVGLPSGAYVARVTGETFHVTRHLTLVR